MPAEGTEMHNTAGGGGSRRGRGYERVPVTTPRSRGDSVKFKIKTLDNERYVMAPSK